MRIRNSPPAQKMGLRYFRIYFPKITRGCNNCYAACFAERWRGVPGHSYEQGFDLKLWPERLGQPLRWKKPRMIFVNSMSDLFHKNIDRNFIDRVFDTMETANWHTCQILTKRSSLMRNYLRYRYGENSAPGHVWCGVSVEDNSATARIEHLRMAPASVRFLSLEPLLGPIGNIDLSEIAWVIVGGESGPQARPMQLEWMLEIRNRCKQAKVPFFFKQWRGRTPKTGGRKLEGLEHNAMPV